MPIYTVPKQMCFPVRMVHGFTSSGLTETQYTTACEAAHIGHVDEKYISTGV